MTISKKITLGALILLAGVCLLPMKTWAATKVDKVTFKGNGDNVDITVTLDDVASGDVFVDVKSSSTTSTIGSITVPDGENQKSEQVSLTYLLTALGNPSAEGDYDITADFSGSSEQYSNKVHLVAPSYSLSKTGEGNVTTTPLVGLTDNNYLLTYTPTSDSKYYLKSCSPPAGTLTDTTIENMKFGTPYTITLDDDPVIKIDSSTPYKTNLTGGTDYEFKLVAEHPNSVDTEKFRVVMPTPDTPLTCSVTHSWSWDDKRLSLKNVKGNGVIDPFKFIYDGKTIAGDFLSITTPVTSVSITGADSLGIGNQSTTYTAEISPEAAMGTPIEWSVQGVLPTFTDFEYSFSSDSSDKTKSKLILTSHNTTGQVVIQANAKGVNSESKIVSILNDTKVTGVSVTNGPSKIVKGKTAQYSATVSPSNASQAVKWSISPEVTGVTVNSDTGLVSVDSSATINDTFNLVVTTVAKNGSGNPETNTQTIKIVSRIDVTSLDILQKITKGYPLDLSNVKYSPSDASVESISWTLTSGSGTISGNKFISEDTNQSVLTASIKYTDEHKQTIDVPITVYKTPTYSSNSDGSISYDFPEAIYTNNSNENNITDVKGYYLEILNESKNKVLSSKSVTGNRNGSISDSTIEEVIRSASSNLSGDSAKVYIRVRPYGTSQTSGQNRACETDGFGYIPDSRTVYRVSVSGSNVVATSIYGQAGKEVEITATPSNSSYKFSKWQDSNTSNPRRVQISSNTNNNKYEATMESRSNSSNSSGSGSGNATGGSKGSNSKLDKVPKTGESMAIYFIVMIAVISGCVAFATLFKSLTAKAAKSEYESSIDSWRGGEDGTGESHKK